MTRSRTATATAVCALFLAACGSSVSSSDLAADGTTSSSITTTTTTTPVTTNVEPTQSDTSSAPAQQCVTIESFDDAEDRWVVVNDGVMGGLSAGGVEFADGVMTFSGFINTDGGGFSLVRSSSTQDAGTLAQALTGAESLIIRARSSVARSYEFTIEDRASAGSSLMYFGDIEIEGSGWVEVPVPLTALEGRFFGNTATEVPALKVDEAVSFGIILADGVDGDFRLEVDRIDACSAS